MEPEDQFIHVDDDAHLDARDFNAEAICAEEQMRWIRFLSPRNAVDESDIEDDENRLLCNARYSKITSFRLTTLPLFASKLSSVLQVAIRDQEGFRRILSEAEDSVLSAVLSWAQIRPDDQEHRERHFLSLIEDCVEIELAFSPSMTSRAEELLRFWRRFRDIVYQDEPATNWERMEHLRFQACVYSCLFRFDESVQLLMDASQLAEGLESETFLTSRELATTRKIFHKLGEIFCIQRRYELAREYSLIALRYLPPNTSYCEKGQILQLLEDCDAGLAFKVSHACIRCGKLVIAEDLVCRHCGTRLDPAFES